MSHRVLLASMPFYTVAQPSVALGLLKAELGVVGVETDVAYLNMSFAEALGLERYTTIASDPKETAMAADWVFAAAVHPDQAERDEAYVQRILRDRHGLRDEEIAVLRRARSLVAGFIDDVLVAIDWTAYDLIGFSSTFQNMASLALARRIKEEHPELKVVFGGYHWTGEMGVELHRCFPFVDYALSGEADETLPALLRLVTGEDDPAGFATLPGLVYREGGETRVGPPSQPIADLDAVPLPDYADYFAALDCSGLADSIGPLLPIEAARGCWWGERRHCTFCSHNGQTIAFRRKSPDRIVDEISTLVDRWRVGSVFMLDSMIAPDYFKTVLPRIAAGECGDIDLLWDVRPTVTRREVGLLVAAGVKLVQPGIESLSSHILRLMDKGTTGLANVRFLRHCKEFGLYPAWNLLYGLPGEEAADYEAMAEMLPALRFLTPPEGYATMRLDRFSPYFSDPEHFGITNVRPVDVYQYLSPFSGDTLARSAGFFDFDLIDGRSQADHVQLIDALVEVWMEAPDEGELRAIRNAASRVVLIDTRADAEADRYVLDSLQTAVYDACRNICSRERLSTAAAVDLADEAGLDACLRWFLEHRLMVREGNRYLTLALEDMSPLDEGAGLALVKRLSLSTAGSDACLREE